MKLSTRPGPPPRTGPAIPHQQLDQNAPLDLQEDLWQRMIALPGVTTGPSGISFPDTRALHLRAELVARDVEAFLIGTEFAHLHGPADGSLHAVLPFDAVDEVIQHGWGELHPVARDGLRPANLVMLFGPRTPDELDIIWQLVQVSHDYATA